MSLPIVPNEQLHAYVAEKVKETDEDLINKIVHEIYANVVASAKQGCYYTIWVTDPPYHNKHVILAANRLRVLFPGSTVEQNRGRAITVEWF